MKGIKNHYDASFKLRAVELSYERSNISELARELGIKASGYANKNRSIS
ncbi:hypothetical protein ACTS9V_06110 [Empedobacter falsenii]